MKLFFLIKEGLAGFKRARLAAVISIVTIMLSLALLGIFGLLAKSLTNQFKQLYSQVHFQVFVDPSLSETQIQALQRKIYTIEGIQDVDFITPEEALADFQKDFGDELVSVLGENPLPPSLRVTLKPDYSKINQIQTVIQQIEGYSAVDEVVFQEKIVRMLNEYFLVGVTVSLAIGTTIFFISALLIFNTIRLTIHSRKTVIDIMRLVGATNFFIKAPFVVEGILQGLVGSLLACGLLWVFVDLLNNTFMPNLSLPNIYIGLLMFTGMFLGLIGSYISIGKYLRF